MTNSKNDKPEPIIEEGQIKIPLEWATAQDVQTVYANQLLVTHAGSEFYFMFGEVVPPAIVGESQIPDHLEVKIVARIAIPKEMMPQFVNAIKSNFERLIERGRS